MELTNQNIAGNVTLNNFIIIDIDKLVKADWNYKQDNDILKEKLKENFKRNGQIENIIVRELVTGFYEIVNGNHRYDAMKELNIKQVIAFNLGKISLAAAQRIAIETNETRFASDTDILAKLLQEINLEFPDEDLINTLPFTPEELDGFLHFNSDDLIVGNPDAEEDDFDPEVLPREAPKTKKGDLYEFESNGYRHRLLCGDSTNDIDVKILMNGDLAHLLYTDPPYNINYTEFNNERAGGKGKDWGEDYCSEWNDEMSDSDYQAFLIKFLKLAKEHMIDWGHYYVWHATTYFVDVLKAFEVNAIPYDKVPIQWVKQVAPISWVRYKRKSEPCVYGGKGAVNGNGAGARWFGPNNETNIWEISRGHNVNYIHPTQKPVALASRAIINSTQQGESVLDMFMGSGTTLIASDMLNRLSYGMEFGEKFCDMITLRFAKYKSDSNSEFYIYRNGQNITAEILEQLDKYKDLKLNQISMPEINSNI